ncbi:FAD binding domain of DNA photolyase-domain-containing protein [Cladochytrium replicatum]|nr:FAD binding domain of DNA photolyase-domain-containing protein [Cladochytrium replicatum]
MPNLFRVVSPQAARPTMNSIVWFRKGLRLHDNQALAAAIASNPAHILPVFCFDPQYVYAARGGINRWMFLLQSMSDLHNSLQSLGSRLIVLRGDPVKVLPEIVREWRCSELCFEFDTEPYGRIRDAKVTEVLGRLGVRIKKVPGHTLYDPDDVIHANGGKAPLTYQGFQKAISSLPSPAPALPTPSTLPPPPTQLSLSATALHARAVPVPPVVGSDPIVADPERRSDIFTRLAGPNGNFDVPTLEELGLAVPPSGGSPYKGGETVALNSMEAYCRNKKKVAKFEKPKTSPAAFLPADTTVLSPHLKFGTLSCRLFYNKIIEVYRDQKSHSEPPVSLLGQILWREFYYTVASVTPNYSIMEGNPVCLQVDWWCRNGPEDPRNPEAAENLKAWTEGRTGYPWIDAIMSQLKKEGWIHHLARHSVACFLTRGDLFISWERGAEVFEELLLDSDWSLNIGNWLWLSASAYYHTYFRVYSPISFGKKYDKSGAYIRRYVPALAKFPAQYIYEPWTAPLSVQKQAGCIIGVDYPKPIVDHEVAMKQNMERMKAAYADGKKGKAVGVGIQEEGVWGPPVAKDRKLEKLLLLRADDELEGGGDVPSEEVMVEKVELSEEAAKMGKKRKAEVGAGSPRVSRKRR